MADRKELQKELNRINQLYQDYDLEMRKSGASIEQRQMMRDMMNKKKEEVMKELGDDLTHLNMGGSKTIKNVNSPIDTKTGMKVGKPVLKKLAGIIPLIGAGSALLSGEPAMAAEELAYDLTGPVGTMAEALKPDTAGNVEEEKQLIAERNAKQKYNHSQAAKDARVARGEPEEYKRPPIGRDKFEAVTGSNLNQADEENKLNDQLKNKDEEQLKKLRQLIHLKGGL